MEVTGTLGGEDCRRGEEKSGIGGMGETEKKRTETKAKQKI